VAVLRLYRKSWLARAGSSREEPTRIYDEILADKTAGQYIVLVILVIEASLILNLPKCAGHASFRTMIVTRFTNLPATNLGLGKVEEYRKTS